MTGIEGQQPQVQQGNTGAGSLRSVMPQTAAFIDELRRQWSPSNVDAVLKAAKAGRCVAYFAELDQAGQLREWGTAPAGRGAQLVDGRIVRGARP